MRSFIVEMISDITIIIYEAGDVPKEVTTEGSSKPELVIMDTRLLGLTVSRRYGGF